MPHSELWAELEKNRPTLAKYQERLADTLGEIGCKSESAPYVIKGLSHRFKNALGDDLALARVVVANFVDETRCPGARGLSESEKAVLREIGDRAQPTRAASGPAVDAKTAQ